MAYERLTTPFTRVPCQILDNKQLSPGEIVTYITILRYSNDLDHCGMGNSMSNDDFMKAIRISSATLQKHLKKLKECGYITVEVTRGNDRVIKINFDAIKTQGDNNAR